MVRRRATQLIPTPFDRSLEARPPAGRPRELPYWNYWPAKPQAVAFYSVAQGGVAGVYTPFGRQESNPRFSAQAYYAVASVWVVEVETGRLLATRTFKAKPNKAYGQHKQGKTIVPYNAVHRMLGDWLREKSTKKEK